MSVAMNQEDFDKEFFDYFFDLEPKDLWVYNKLQVSRMLGYVCGPVGVKVHKPDNYIVRPTTNWLGCGIGAHFTYIQDETDHLTPGHFWCEIFRGNHYSVDFEYGKRVRTTEGIHGDSIMHWKKWITVEKDFSFPSILSEFKDKPHVNCEFIGDKLIEVHLRNNPNFCYNNSVFIPVWEGDIIDPPVGHTYIDCPALNGRIGAYIDIT